MSVSTSPQPLPEKRPNKRVLVLGAGMSGLVAALALKQAGCAVSVFEAQNRPGGRVHTIRDAAGTPIAEAGAGRIPASHTWTMHYVERFGLATERLYGGDLLPVLFMQGKRLAVTRDDDPARAFDLPREEQETGYDGLLRDTYYRWVERVRASGAMHSTDWPPQALRDLDRCSTRECLREQMSEAATQLLTLGVFPDTISPLGLARVLATYSRDNLLKLRDGNDALPRALADCLESQISYGSPVRAICQEPDGVVVTVEQQGRRRQVRGDAVVCTLPFSVLPEVAISPPLSAGKQRILSEIRYVKATKVAIVTRTRYWEREGLSGFAQTDSKSEIWSPRGPNAAGTGVLQLYQKGGRAELMDGMDPAGRGRFAVEAVNQVFPGLDDHVVSTHDYSWQCDPWAKGAYGIALPGQAYAWKDALTRPEGRIHFAGEHTSLEYAAWIEGAVRSGHRAAAEIAG